MTTYEGWCKHDLVQIRWNMPLQQTWNLLRGADPQPRRLERVRRADGEALRRREDRGGKVSSPLTGDRDHRRGHPDRGPPTANCSCGRCGPKGARRCPAAEWAGEAGVKEERGSGKRIRRLRSSPHHPPSPETAGSRRIADRTCRSPRSVTLEKVDHVARPHRREPVRNDEYGLLTHQ